MDCACRWAVEEGADYIVAETICIRGEALLALEAIKQYDIPAVVTLTSKAPDGTTNELENNMPLEQLLKELEDKGADVVGFNCARGPNSMLPLMKKARQACKGHLAAVPVPYRTTPEKVSFFQLTDLNDDSLLSFPDNLDEHLVSRRCIREFTEEARDLDFKYLGICCGNTPGHMRSMAEALGRQPEASLYSPNMKKHYILGNDSSFLKMHTQHFRKKICGSHAEGEDGDN